MQLTAVLDRRRLTGFVGAILLALAALLVLDASPQAVANPAGAAPRIGISKIFAVPPSPPPGTLSYLVRVDNFGGSAASGARLVDPLPQGIDAYSWTCTAIFGAICANASGSGAIDEALDDLVSGGSLEYEITATVAASPPPFVTNVAQVDLLPGGTCANDETPPCRATLVAATGARLFVNITPPQSGFAPGSAVQFDARVASVGDADAAGTIFRVPVAGGLTDVSWTCNAPNSGACPAGSGTGPIDLVLDNVPSGAVLDFSFSATVAPIPPPGIALIVVAIPPYGGSCEVGGAVAPPCAVSAIVPTVPKVESGLIAELAGNTIVYSLSLLNIGVDAGASVVSDPLPVGVSNFSWSCSASDGALCPNPVGSGAISETIATWPTGGSLNFQINATLAVQPPAIVVNTATITTPAGGLCGQFESTPAPCQVSVETNVNQGGLGIIKFADRAAVSAGEFFDYTIELNNNTASLDASGSVFEDQVPAGIDAFFIWTCASTGSALCPVANGSGPINATITSFPPGSGLVYSITALVGSSPPSTISNIATLTPPVGVNVTCDSDAPTPPCVAQTDVVTAPLIGVSKFSNVGGASPGGLITYILDIYNFGTEAATVQVDDPLPTGIASATWTCSGDGAVCPQVSGTGAISATLTALGNETGVNYLVQATVAAAPPALITNALTVAPPAGSLCVINDQPGLTPPPCVAQASNRIAPLLELTKTGSGQQLLLNGSARYEIQLRNFGGNADGTVLTDPVPAGLELVTWTCNGFLGAVCPAFSGNGPINATFATLPANGYLQYTIDAVVSSTAPDSITNVATITPPAGGACANDSCTASVSQSVALAPSADLAVTKTADVAMTTPGSPIVWTIDVTNLGALPASNLQISDPVPAGIDAMSWTCQGPECPAPSGAGAINLNLPSFAVYEIDGPDFPVRSGRLLFTATGTVSATPPPIVNNVVTLVPADGATCQFAVCTATSSVPSGVVGAAVLELAQSANAPEMVPGETVDYTIVLVNSGTADAGLTVLENPIPAGIEAFVWTCAASAGANCPNASGIGAINHSLALVPAGATLTYVITAVIAASPPAMVVNSAIVTPPAAATCIPASCTSVLSLPTVAAGQAVLAIAKAADRASLVPGGNVQYTVTVANVGTIGAGPSLLSDVIPVDLTSFAWTCQSTGSAVCPEASGSGSISQSVTLPPASTLVYVVQANVSATASGTITNVASLIPAQGVSCNPASCSAARALPVQTQPNAADITVSKTANPAAGVTLSAGQRVTWTLRANNIGGAATTALTVIDELPSNISNTVVSTGAGISCNATTPAPGSTLVCSVASGFTGQRTVTISADVSGPDESGRVLNTITVDGGDGAACSPCSVVHPVSAAVDITLRNARPFSAAGIAGTLIDVVNLEPSVASNIMLSLSPVASRRLFALYSSGCTATPGPLGQVHVSCPSPPQSQGASCSGSQCTIALLPANTAVTLFVALNAGTTATLTAVAAGDIVPTNNTIELSAGDAP